MNRVTLIGIDLGKHSFHLHGQDAAGRMVFRKKLTRVQMFTLPGDTPACTVAMEACAGAHWVARRVQAVLAEHELPPRLVALLERLQAHVKYLDEQAEQVERELTAQLREDERSERLLEIPGVGPITASVLMTELDDAQQFGSAKQFAASVGLVPRQYNTGGKPTLLGISKRGDKNLRRLLVQCARVLLLRIDRRTDALGAWVRSLLTRRHSNVVACALANKLARIAWAILARGTHYRSEPAVATA